MSIRSRLLLTLCLVFPLAPVAADEATCIDSERATEAILGLPPMAARTEELIRLGLSEGVTSESIFLLTRQMMLTERIHRHLVERGDCASMRDALERDISILKRVYVAFADGDAALQIDAMKSEQSQAILSELLRMVETLDAQL